MEAFRIRKAKSLYDPAKMHVFLEVEKSRWLEVESLSGITFESIGKFLESEKLTGIKIVGFTDQSFQNGTIKDWIDAGMIVKIEK